MNDQDWHEPQNSDDFSEERFEREQKKHNSKHQDDRLDSLTWALILIWAGLVFLARNLGWLEQIQVTQPFPEVINIVGLSTWSLIALGAGLLILVEGLIRIIVPAYRSSFGGNFFLAAIFIGIGVSGIFGWRLVWPFILIAMGFSALVSALVQSRR